MFSHAISKIIVAIVIAVIVVIAIVAAVAVVMRPPTPSPTPATPTSPISPSPTPITPIVIKWGVTPPGTYGYKISGIVMEYIRKELPDWIKITITTYPGSMEAAKAAVVTGEINMAYIADIAVDRMIKRLYPFAPPFKAEKILTHSLHFYTVDGFFVVSKDKADKYKCWKDLSGKPIAFYTSTSTWWYSCKYVWDDLLGYGFNHVEVGPKAIGDALMSGAIEGAAVYLLGNRIPPPWFTEFEVKIPLEVVNPSPEEINIMKAAGLKLSRVDPKYAFTQKVSASEIYTFPSYYGYYATTDIPEEAIYLMVKALEKHVREIAEIEPGFSVLAEDFVGYYVGAINAFPDIPVHPGLAKFLKEKGVWNPNWKIAS